MISATIMETMSICCWFITDLPLVTGRLGTSILAPILRSLDLALDESGAARPCSSPKLERLAQFGGLREGTPLGP